MNADTPAPAMEPSELSELDPMEVMPNGYTRLANAVQTRAQARRAASGSLPGGEREALLEMVCRFRCAEQAVDPDKLVEGKGLPQWRWMIEDGDIERADAILAASPPPLAAEPSRD